MTIFLSLLNIENKEVIRIVEANKVNYLLVLLILALNRKNFTLSIAQLIPALQNLVN